jgi:ankyrin repeat protein
MDKKFHPALAAIKSDDLEKFKALIAEDPTLATERSSRSHPTLLQAVSLDGLGRPNNVEMAKVLVAAGAELNEPLVSCGSMGNVKVGELLLDCGAKVDGTGGWSPLEEALYWGNEEFVKLILARGGRIRNLRTAAALGRMDLLPTFFNEDGSLKPEAGRIDWPFGELVKSNSVKPIKDELQAKANSWTNAPLEIINNAFVYACMGNHIDAARFLLDKGADINAIPHGFDYAGTGLHYAALRGHRGMVEFLLGAGADPNIKDTKVGATPSGWADHGGYPELRDYLNQVKAG